jgi:hypothetical protein
MEPWKAVLKSGKISYQIFYRTPEDRGVGKGYVFIALPPTSERGGYTVFQPCVAPEAKGGPR